MSCSRSFPARMRGTGAGTGRTRRCWRRTVSIVFSLRGVEIVMKGGSDERIDWSEYIRTECNGILTLRARSGKRDGDTWSIDVDLDPG